MTPLGEAIIIAAAAQGFSVYGDGEVIVIVSPYGQGNWFELPRALFMAPELEMFLRIELLKLAVAGGLEWPWPPQHVEGIYGETPTTDW